MESACVRDFHTSCWSIWNRTSERSKRVRFLILYQRVRKSRTKRFPCCNLFILYILRFSHQILLCEKSVSDFTSTNQKRKSQCVWNKILTSTKITAVGNATKTIITRAEFRVFQWEVEDQCWRSDHWGGPSVKYRIRNSVDTKSNIKSL